MIVQSDYVAGRNMTKEILSSGRQVRVRCYRWSGRGVRYTDPVHRVEKTKDTILYNIIVKPKKGAVWK